MEQGSIGKKNEELSDERQAASENFDGRWKSIRISTRKSTGDKIGLFLKLYRGRHTENVILMVLYILMVSAVSMVLFVQDNNEALIAKQLTDSGLGDMSVIAKTIESTENIFGIIVLITLFVGAAGTICLIYFRNQSSEKSQAILRIFGMKKKDIVVKALLDAVIYGGAAGVAGLPAGYGLFVGFSKDIMGEAASVGILSPHSAAIFAKAEIFMLLIIILSNLYADYRMMSRPVVELLYERNGEHAGINTGKNALLIPIMVLLVTAYVSMVFHVSIGTLRIMLCISGIISFLSYLLFLIFFKVLVQGKRKRRHISSVADIIRCFMCRRSRRDILLSCVISMGTVLICIAANVRFNIGGILRSAYRDNMGYSILVRVDDYSYKDNVEAVLDDMGIGYTFAYSKLMNYSDLNGIEGMGENDKLYVLVIGKQTDNNEHFSVPAHSVIVENYFANKCGLKKGIYEYPEGEAVFGNSEQGYIENNFENNDSIMNSADIDLFGSHVTSWSLSEDNQYLSLVNYNVMINDSDWGLGIGEAWSPIFLIDASVSEEKEIDRAISGYSCHIESATEIIDEIKNIMTDYFRIIIVMAAALILVISSVFYTLIRKDLTGRRTELFLYRVFGASGHQADMVIFGEYTIIAVVSAMVVTVTVLGLGELYFYYGLRKHFPFSAPILLITTGAAMIFVFLCCKLAEAVSRRGVDVYVIRDE